MKNLIYLILFVTTLYPAELILNRYQDGLQSVDLYHLIDNKSIECIQEYGTGFQKVIRCTLKNPIKKDFHKQNDRYFDIQFNDSQILFYAKSYVKLIGIDDALKDKDNIHPLHNYNHWVIVGSIKEPKVFANKGNNNFNYPVAVAKHKTPYISALDLNGEPIKHKKGALVLSQVKKLYKLKKYKALVSTADEYLNKYQDGFSSDIALYKLRSQMHLAQSKQVAYENISQNALDWISKNPSNEHIPEVYEFVIQSYFKRGRLDLGEKYLRILESAFRNNKYTQKANIEFADAIYKSKKRRKEALKIYKDVLYATKDLDTASLAAMKIAKTYLDINEPDKASKLFEKVFKSNKTYIKSSSKDSYALAKKFAKMQRYPIAIKIVKELITDTDDKKQEEYLKNLGIWLEKSKDYKGAMQMYNQYIKTYKKGQYIGFVKEHLDGLMIHTEEDNSTKKLIFLDTIMQQYKQTPIYKNALKEKVDILFHAKRYNDIIRLKDELIQYGYDKDLNKSARLLVEQALNAAECTKAISLKDEYHVTVEEDYQEKLFHCLVKVGQYKSALKIANAHIKTKKLSEKLKWLYNVVNVYSKLGLNKKAVLAGEDVLKLSKTLGTTKYDDVLYTIAQAYYDLKDYDDLMLSTVQRIEQRFHSDIRNIDLFMKVLKYAQKKQDVMLVINYAKKVISLQKKYKIDVYTPKVEIQYVYALKKIRKPKTALEEAKKIDLDKISDIQKAELLYLEGDLSITLGKEKEAKRYFLKCGEIVQDSSWQKMCAEHFKLLDE